jgi:hypothetical protein
MSDAQEPITYSGEQALQFLEAEIAGLEAQIALYRGMLKASREQHADLTNAIAQGHEIILRIEQADDSFE